MIGRVRRVLVNAIGRSRPEPTPQLPAKRRGDADRRFDAARKRLKATIPPPVD